ncbi:50S ribosomal protein L18 [Parachlamydia sp. AcF125]|uniref:50S ribosomal protein L18 n=1 Tax=Parachlamydia sp. AcF125 TaxID=2795736 RepID=UPI001BC91E11|nr:50S ribosomal protein L18 [Parachlamydia sp. AcF125]MBS4167439.1 50S ribosomal protein L18 [Parachlamydia sp. AcF125]
MRSELIRIQAIRKKRTMRIRKKIHGTSVEPRLCVVKSNKHLQVQLIDDDAGVTLGSIATFSKEYRESEFGKKSKQAARKLGEHIAKIASEQNIKAAKFDRGPAKFHGVLAELKDAAVAAGLKC